jgi:hypothetical protein
MAIVSDAHFGTGMWSWDPETCTKISLVSFIQYPGLRKEGRRLFPEDLFRYDFPYFLILQSDTNYTIINLYWPYYVNRRQS